MNCNLVIEDDKDMCDMLEVASDAAGSRLQREPSIIGVLTKGVSSPFANQ